MSKVLTKLTEDHDDFRVFLDGLERQINRLERSVEVDFDIIRGVAEYFQDYADPVHHPLEEAVLDKLHERAPDVAEKSARVSSDHARLETEVAVFLGAVNAILQDEEVSRDEVILAVRRFVSDERAHMAAEEQMFFKAAQEHLTDADWAETEALLEKLLANPDLPSPDRYEALRAEIAGKL